MDELKDIAPELSKMKKETPFRTPKNYFEDFSARMDLNVAQEKAEPNPEPKANIIQLLKPALGLAASFALIFLLVYVPVKTFMPKEITQVAETTSEFSDNDFYNIVEGIGENAYLTMLEESASEEENYTEEDLTLLVSANFTDFEIYENLGN